LPEGVKLVAAGGMMRQVVECPACKGDDVIVASTRASLKHYLCRACGKRFKSSAIPPRKRKPKPKAAE
jgi:transposase-like protein